MPAVSMALQITRVHVHWVFPSFDVTPRSMDYATRKHNCLLLTHLPLLPSLQLSDIRKLLLRFLLI